MQERARLEELLSKSGHRLLRYIKSLINNNLRNQVSAEDILNEVVRYALERPEHWRKRSNEDLFIFFLWKSKLLVIDKARHLKVAAKANAGHGISTIEKGGVSGRIVEPSPTFLIHRRAKRSAMESYLERLPNGDHREALRLVRIEGLSLSQAARVMGRSAEAIRKLVKRGLLNLARTARAAGAAKFETSGETT